MLIKTLKGRVIMQVIYTKFSEEFNLTECIKDDDILFINSTFQGDCEEPLLVPLIAPE